MDEKLIYLVMFFFLIILSAGVYATVTCNFTWNNGQKVIVNGVTYQCPSNAKYCYSPGQATGEAKCCDWCCNDGSKNEYTNCQSIGPTDPVQSCTENWECTPTPVVCDWKTGDNVRNCVDKNNCGTTNNKPVESVFWYKLTSENTPASRIVANITVFSGSGSLSSKLEYYPCDPGLVATVKGTYKFGMCCPPNQGSHDCTLVYPRKDINTTEPYNRKTLKQGSVWNLGSRVTLTVNSIDAKARQVWLTLSVDGIKKDDKVITSNQSYYYEEKSSCGETDVTLFSTFVKSIYSGATEDLVQLTKTYVSTLWWSCTENWDCGSWTSCLNNQQIRECIDTYTCGTTNNKPLTTRPCCTENWDCGNWSACVNGQQTKICTDSVNCGTEFYKPSTTQNCTVVTPSTTPLPSQTPTLTATPTETPQQTTIIDNNKTGKIGVDDKHLLGIIIKMEQLKTKLSFLKTILLPKLINYYNLTNNFNSSSKWSRALQNIQDGMNRIESIKNEISDKLSTFTVDNLRKVKKDVKSVAAILKNIS